MILVTLILVTLTLMILTPPCAAGCVGQHPQGRFPAPALTHGSFSTECPTNLFAQDRTAVKSCLEQKR